MENRDFWENDKVKFRTIEKQDAEQFLNVLQNMALRIQLEAGVSLPVMFEDAEDIVEYAREMTDTEKEIWFCVMDKTEHMVGYALLGHINEKNGTAQSDVVILPEYRKNGYGKKALQLLLKYAFLEKRLHKINTTVMEENIEGQSFLVANGFSLEAVRKDMVYGSGKYYDKYYYGITVEEYGCAQNGKKEMSYHPEESIEEKVFDNLSKKRPYFWQYGKIEVCLMTEEDYYSNRAMLFSERDMRFYHNEIQLPKRYDELTEREENQILYQDAEGRIEFAIYSLDEKYLGNINLCELDEKNGTFSVSLYFLPKARKKGYATQAMALILYYAFLERRMHKLNICVNDGNKDSEKLMYRLGCHYEGKLRENVFYDGKYVDVLLFGLTKEKFDSLLN